MPEMEILKQPNLDIGFYITVYAIITFLGLTIGSFLNVCIYRIPNNQSIVKKPSHCMTCGEKIRKRDLIPLFSWIFLKGKCRSCGAKISPRYPAVELLNAIIYIITFTVLDINANSIILCLFFSLLIVIAFIDIDTFEMEPWMLIAAALFAIPSALLSDHLTILQRITGALYISVPFFIIGEVYRIITKNQDEEGVRGIELGDTFLMAAAGLVIGNKAIVVAAFAGILLAAVGGLISKAITKESKIPFGPYLAMGIIIGALFGSQLVDWYVGFLIPTEFPQ